MSELFAFGDKVDGYNVRVFNERVVRAAAGILFFPALVAFMNAWLAGNFQPIRLFVIIFLIDFTIRLFINPRYAPSMILGQWMVRKQQPDYSGAPQKRFAWGYWFCLGIGHGLHHGVQSHAGTHQFSVLRYMFDLDVF